MVTKRREAYIHWMMTVVGGFLGTYAILLHEGIFASAQTGNLMEIAIEWLDGDLIMIIYRLFALICFGVAIVVAFCMSNYTKLPMQKIAILTDGAGLLLSSMLPLKPVFVGLYPISFCAAFQWGVYSMADGYNSSSIFSTNNFKQSILGWTQYFITKDKEYKKKAILYTGSVVSFFTGAALGAWAVQMFGVYGAYIGFCPLACAWILVSVKADKAQVVRCAQEK